METLSDCDLAAAWRGEELLARPDWLHVLDEGDRAEIAGALAGVRDLPVEKIEREGFRLPGLEERLGRIQENLETGSGACLVRGLKAGDWNLEECRRVFAGLAAHVGTLVSQSAKGEKIFSVRDEGFAEGDARVRGPSTNKKLSFHTDRCDVIGFLCLQQAKAGGENELVSSAALYREIAQRKPDLLEVLEKPFLYKRHTVDGGNANAYCRQPVFSFREGRFACAFLRVLIERAHADPEMPSLTEMQREALDFLEEVAAEPEMHVRFRQEPGDIVFLNNWVTLHRRSAFEDYEEPERRRHILRAWISTPNSRPLDPLFLDNYGAIEAGAIRGGMRALEA